MMDHYQVLDEIGKGSFGTVFKAKRNSGQTKDIFAIKKVHCNVAENVELALQEFWTLSSLRKHLNIIRFDECFLEHQGKTELMHHGDHSSPDYLHLVELSLKGKRVLPRDQYLLSFVMEYCDAGDMNDYLLSRAPLAKMNASFINQLADGIAFLHHNNVVHRDLKPENVLIQSIDKSGDNVPIPTIKIADFGLSKICTSSNQETKNGANINNCWFTSACGSDFYMAPEVFIGHYTAKADVFALGIMIWSIMDRITFRDASTDKVLLGTYVRRNKEVLPVGETMLDEPQLDLARMLHATGLPHPVVFTDRRRRNTVSDGSTCVTGDKEKLRRLVSFMIHPNPDKRPTSNELLDTLKAILASPDLDSISSTTPEGTRLTRSRSYSCSELPDSSPFDDDSSLSLAERCGISGSRIFPPSSSQHNVALTSPHNLAARWRGLKEIGVNLIRFNAADRMTSSKSTHTTSSASKPMNNEPTENYESVKAEVSAETSTSTTSPTPRSTSTKSTSRGATPLQSRANDVTLGRKRKIATATDATKKMGFASRLLRSSVVRALTRLSPRRFAATAAAKRKAMTSSPQRRHSGAEPACKRSCYRH